LVAGAALFGVGPPSTLAQSALYYEQDVSLNVTAVSLGTSGSPAKVLDASSPIIYGTQPAASSVVDATVHYSTVSGNASQARSSVWVPVGPQYATVTADTVVVNNSTTLVNLTGLGIAITASSTEIWMAKFWLMINGSTAGDFKLGWATVPTSATILWGPASVPTTFGGFGATTTASSPLPMSTQVSTVNFGLGGSTAGISVIAFINGGGTAGTVQIQAAQATADVSDLTIKKGSTVEYVKVRA
jgi:hypothetical protein